MLNSRNNSFGHRLFTKGKTTRVGAGFPVNYEEDSVGTYVLPDLLTMQNGRKVNDAKTWMEKRRPEIVKLFEDYQFGKMPLRPADMHFDVFDKGTEVLNGKAIRKQVRVYFTKDTNHKMDLLIYLPKSSKPSPLLLIINFSANASVVDDPEVRRGEIWTREGKKIPAPAISFGRINIDTFITNGFGIATVYYGDIEPDFKTGCQYGIRLVSLHDAQLNKNYGQFFWNERIISLCANKFIKHLYLFKTNPIHLHNRPS